jgi:outer membrane protein assembly factor BamB
MALGADRLYTANISHVDGPGIYVGAFDSADTPFWQQNQYGECRIDVSDKAGALALNDGTAFYGANYATGMGVMLPFDSGLYAFDSATGEEKFFQRVTVTGDISAGNGLVYLIEGSNTLVARSQADGSLAWSQPVVSSGAQAPVLAMGPAIVATPTAS